MHVLLQQFSRSDRMQILRRINSRFNQELHATFDKDKENIVCIPKPDIKATLTGLRSRLEIYLAQLIKKMTRIQARPSSRARRHDRERPTQLAIAPVIP
jgi:hypothetical protein